MKKKVIYILLLLLLFAIVFYIRPFPSKTQDIDGILTGYVQAEEYANSLAVIDDNGVHSYELLEELTLPAFVIK